MECKYTVMYIQEKKKPYFENQFDDKNLLLTVIYFKLFYIQHSFFFSRKP